MSDLKKDMGQEDGPSGMPSESDPKRLAERHNDSQSQFLDMYRSLDLDRVDIDQDVVDSLVTDFGVIPETIRYGYMRGAYRGAVKSTTGELFYFNYAPEENTFKAVPADSTNQVWEVEKLLKSCKLGCDLNRNGEVAQKASAATIPDDEDDYQRAQHRMATEHHYNGAGAPTPDKPEVGRNWHEPIRRAGDALKSLGTNDGEQHWNTSSLMKAWGQQLQATAPRIRPQLDPLEVRFATEHLGKSMTDVESGRVTFSPRDQAAFQQWKSTELRGNISPLASWLEKHRG